MDDTTPTEHVPITPPRRRGSVRRFNGWQRSNNDWDGLRKDTELWLEDGDCSVHLYILGGSQRGPSLRLRYADVEALRCDYLTEQCLHVQDTSTPMGSDDGASDSGYASSHISKLPTQYELYIPAPASCSREQAYAYHLTTRNFFAYASGKPLVGEKLGVAMAQLLDRIREWQPKTAALANFTSYCQDQGYHDMANNADCALACLTLAEHARVKDLWIEAFVHCVGMHEKLDLSAEYIGLSKTTKALITRASLEMDLHIARVIRALGTFLEEELGPENLGLSKAARDHLDRFRSCLHNYYVAKLGYFPPNEEGPWNKRLWTKMYHAFQTLYEYLVDNESSVDRLNDRGVTGGICVAQNVKAFDTRHGYNPLPHPLPLLPEVAPRRRTADQQKGLRNFKLGRMDSQAEQLVTTREALAKATNAGVQDVMGCELVEQYQRFERQKLEEKLTPAEARKVRWLLVYGALQMLISITRAPKEVRDTESPEYPLCVLTAGGPAWLNDVSPDNRPTKTQVLAAASLSPLTPEEDADERISIHPDCEAETAGDYFSSHMLSRQPSALSLEMTPAPLRITTQISRTASIRSSVHSSVHALHKSFVGSINCRRNSLRRMPTNRPLSKSNSGTSFCEILIEGYGNGADAGHESVRRETLMSLEDTQPSIDSASLAAFDFGLDQLNEEPMLEDAEVDTMLVSSQARYDFSSLERAMSEDSLSSKYSGSSSSSVYMKEYDSPATEMSPWDSDESKRNSEITDDDLALALPEKIERPVAPKRHSYQRKELNFGTNMGLRTRCYSVNAGCYTPTGMVTPPTAAITLPMSKFYQQRAQSSDPESAATSSASSTYGDDGMQAADIEEEEMRGRRRSRALDRLSSEEMEAEGRRLCFVEQ